MYNNDDIAEIRRNVFDKEEKPKIIIRDKPTAEPSPEALIPRQPEKYKDVVAHPYDPDNTIEAQNAKALAKWDAEHPSGELTQKAAETEAVYEKSKKKFNEGKKANIKRRKQFRYDARRAAPGRGIGAVDLNAEDTPVDRLLNSIYAAKEFSNTYADDFEYEALDPKTYEVLMDKDAEGKRVRTKYKLRPEYESDSDYEKRFTNAKKIPYFNAQDLIKYQNKLKKKGVNEEDFAKDPEWQRMKKLHDAWRNGTPKRIKHEQVRSFKKDIDKLIQAGAYHDAISNYFEDNPEAYELIQNIINDPEKGEKYRKRLININPKFGTMLNMALSNEYSDPAFFLGEDYDNELKRKIFDKAYREFYEPVAEDVIGQGNLAGRYSDPRKAFNAVYGKYADVVPGYIDEFLTSLDKEASRKDMLAAKKELTKHENERFKYLESLGPKLLKYFYRGKAYNSALDPYHKNPFFVVEKEANGDRTHAPKFYIGKTVNDYRPPLYETDANGNVRYDANGKPLRKFDPNTGRPMYGEPERRLNFYTTIPNAAKRDRKFKSKADRIFANNVINDAIDPVYSVAIPEGAYIEDLVRDSVPLLPEHSLPATYKTRKALFDNLMFNLQQQKILDRHASMLDELALAGYIGADYNENGEKVYFHRPDKPLSDEQKAKRLMNILNHIAKFGLGYRVSDIEKMGIKYAPPVPLSEIEPGDDYRGTFSHESLVKRIDAQKDEFDDLKDIFEERYAAETKDGEPKYEIRREGKSEYVPFKNFWIGRFFDENGKPHYVKYLGSQKSTDVLNKSSSYGKGTLQSILDPEGTEKADKEKAAKKAVSKKASEVLGGIDALSTILNMRG